MWNEIQNSWFLAVNDFARSTPWLHAPMRLYAEYGVVLFAALLLLSWWLARGVSSPKVMAAALWAPFGTLLAVGLNQPLVNAVGEERPFQAFPDALLLVSRSYDHAFPSDHAVMAGAVAAGILLANRRLGLVAVGAALVMAFARVYVGAHFPMDVVVGLVFGAGVALGSFALLRPFLVWTVDRLERTSLRVFLTARTAEAAR